MSYKQFLYILCFIIGFFGCLLSGVAFTQLEVVHVFFGDEFNTKEWRPNTWTLSIYHEIFNFFLIIMLLAISIFVIHKLDKK